MKLILPKKQYKTARGYAKAVYKLNKNYFDENSIVDLAEVESTFVRAVKEVFENKLYDSTLHRNVKTMKEAVEQVRRSGFISKERRFQEFVSKQLKGSTSGQRVYEKIKNQLRTATPDYRAYTEENIRWIGTEDSTFGTEEIYEYYYEKKVISYVYEEHQTKRGIRKHKVRKEWIESRTIQFSWFISDKSGGGGYWQFRGVYE